jgi:hypothetical protein
MRKTAYDIIQELKERGELQALIESGYLSSVVYRHLRAYEELERKRRAGAQKTVATSEAGEKVGYEERQMYVIRKRMTVCTKSDK